MSKVITFSRTYPSYHPKAGQPTYFVEKILQSLNINPIGVDAFQYFEKLNTDVDSKVLDSFVRGLQFGHDHDKHHTIRSGHRWKAGDWFSPRVWSGKPYRSKMIQFATDIEIKKVWDFHLNEWKFLLPGINEISKNDGLSVVDFMEWFHLPQGKDFNGQIICWNENINY